LNIGDRLVTSCRPRRRKEVPLESRGGCPPVRVQSIAPEDAWVWRAPLEEGLLSWPHVVERLEAASRYWLATAGRDGRVHARPVDAILVEETLYFSVGDVRWMKDLRENPRISVHLESASDVVILDGRVEWVDGPPELVVQINEASQRRHEWDTAPGWALPPEVAFAWTNLGVDATTRWQLEG
jgi:hypothetical protein